ncbi:MAG: hypothetical protein EBT30_08290 [Verrucomicrobia bacterium]|nr:hypothetical protein [Verrucomicrobiota bacterium]
MRWCLYLWLGLFSTGLWAEAPMDLESPFLKTALIKENNGLTVEKAVRKGKIKGGIIELERDEGGLLVLPAEQVLAVLPKIPLAGTTYLQSDAQRALETLSKAQKIYPERVEVSPIALIEWDKLSHQVTEADQAERKALELWFQSASEVPPEAKTEEIRALVEQGEGFAEKFPDQEKRIYDQVRGLKEISKIDLSKTANLIFPIGNFGDNFVPGAILWAILLIPIILVIHGISGAIQGFKERLPLAALLRFFIVLLAGSFLVLVLWPDSIPQPNGNRGTQSIAQRALWLSRNLVEGWADQPVHKINMSFEAWQGLVLEKLQPGVEDLSSLLWYMEKPVFAKINQQLYVLQPLVLKIVPVTLKFVFNVPEKGRSWNDAELISFQVGRLPLGKFVGSLALQPMAYAYEGVRSSYGLDKGVQWMSGEAGALVVEIPSAHQKRPQAKETISAKELAEVYDQGFGDVYKDRYVVVEGDLVEVQSRKEIIGGDLLKKEDPFDEFYLDGLPIDKHRRIGIRVRCQIKSDETYFMDGKGDLYKGAPNPQNPNKDMPILRKGTGATKVRISAGRIESGASERRSINIYDCRKLEGFEAGF